MAALLDTSVQYLKGVGPVKYKLFNKLGIKTVQDLLFYFPRRHEDRSNFIPVGKLRSVIGEFKTIKGVINSAGIFRTKGGLTIFQLAVSDGTGTVYGTWFNQPYLKKYFNKGDNIILYGKVQQYQRLQMNVPEYELITHDEDESVHMGRIVPIYPLTESVRQRMLRSTANVCVSEFSGRVIDPVPKHVKVNQCLTDLRVAIKHVHFPDSFSALETARNRLIFDEFFFLQTALALKKSRLKSDTSGIAHKIDGQLVKSFMDVLPFSLTNAQEKVLGHIAADMQSPKPMCRLLQGDVGSGKTIVAAYAMTVAKQSGYQSVMMAPTEILAGQHYLNLNKLLSPLGVKIGLLTSGLSAAEKNKIKKLIKSGDIDIIVGTHSLIEEDVKFSRLSLAVVDEQHKFGVAQRLILTQKSSSADVLVMTATPIPRTLALTVYGDMDISVIDEMPPGRLPVKTYLFDEQHREKIYNFMRSQIKEGRQVFVIYPLIDESAQKQQYDSNGQMVFTPLHKSSANLKAAAKMYDDFKSRIFSDLKVGLVHGRMSSDEKDKVLNDFRVGNIDILVSTIVVEVGIDMPNASVMVIEHAERFGLAQLHQLRGRIGRSSYQSYCILIADAKTENAKMRMDAMLATHDGFKIAERDLEIRGPGDFMGVRQHGLPDFRIANIVTDIKILEQAKQEAFGVVSGDPDLSRTENSALRAEVAKRFPDMAGLVL